MAHIRTLEGGHATKVGLVTIATGGYTNFVPALLESASRYFCINCDRSFFVLTDSRVSLAGVTQLRVRHRAWPGVALMKYQYLTDHADVFSGLDYLFLCDADMRFVAPVGDEVLRPLVAVRHPGYYDKPRSDFPYHVRPDSAACMPRNVGQHYCGSGFMGGEARRYLAAAKHLASVTRDDLGRGVIPVWHDESYWNRYVAESQEVVYLPPSYLYPDDRRIPFEPKLMCVAKDHEAVRRTRGWGQYWMRLRRKCDMTEWRLRYLLQGNRRRTSHERAQQHDGHC